MREYKTVRLAYEAKAWINGLILEREKKLQQDLKEKTIAMLEDETFENNRELLDGVSVTLALRVTAGSVIEEAFRKTQGYTDEEWAAKAIEMEAAINELDTDEVNVDSITPRLYLNTDVIDGFSQMRLRLKTANGGVARLSYCMKLVVYAYMTEIAEKGERYGE